MNGLIVNEGMLKTKADLELVNTEVSTIVNDMNTNLDSIVLNWTGKKAKVVLEPIERIKLKNTEILNKITAKAEEIGKAYETYLKNSETEIVASPVAIAEPTTTTTTGAEQTTPIPTVVVQPSTEPISSTKGPLITPNISGLKFSYDKQGNIKKQGDTDFYPVTSSDGTRYLLYLGGRKPTDPIPSNMQIVFGLHGYGERATGSGSELRRLFNNGIPKYLNSNSQDVIAIVPQIRDGNSYDNSTITSLHNIYNDVKTAFGANSKMDASGISMGGHTLLKYAAVYPQDFSTITIVSGAPRLDMGFFKFTPEQQKNLQNSNILIVSGKNDWSNGQSDRAKQLYTYLTGSTGIDYSVSKNDSMLEIAKQHKESGGIAFVQVEDAGHNTWDYATPGIIAKYN